MSADLRAGRHGMDGVRLDLKALEELSKQLTEELSTIEHEIVQMAGIDFNVNSPNKSAKYCSTG
jgi:DNA polymerase-1